MLTTAVTTNIIKVRGVSKAPDSVCVDVLSLEEPYLFRNLIKSCVTHMDVRPGSRNFDRHFIVLQNGS